MNKALLNNTQIDRRLFNCVTEIRDVCGYELALTNNAEKTIKNGNTQLKWAILSGAPATVFTNESCWIQQITTENWETEIVEIINGIADLSPKYDTLDNVSRYVRASYNIKIDRVMLDECGNLKLKISGTNDMDTKFYMFFDKDDNIVMKEHIIPRNYK